MEDLDLVRRIGLRRVKVLRARAVSNAARYRRDGYLRHALGNQAQRILYSLHLSRRAPRSPPVATSEVDARHSRRRNFAVRFGCLSTGSALLRG